MRRLTYLGIVLAALLGSAAPAWGRPLRVELNSATVQQLMQLPGVGNKRAQTIVRYRHMRLFRRPSDLLRIRGIGRSVYLHLKPYVQVRRPDATVRPPGSTPPTPNQPQREELAGGS